MITDEYQRNGFASQSFALAEPAACAGVLEDAPLFDRAVAAFAQQGIAGVPYQNTEAITRLAHDTALIAVVRTLLQSDDWVMWGANVRRSVPNAAHHWHVDLESVLWPSVTVAVGLEGCDRDSATWFLPGTHALRRGPVNWLPADASNEEVIATAQRLGSNQAVPTRTEGFANGHCTVFNGACWHRADVTGSQQKTVLYLHYQRPQDKRIPLMLDYATHHWSPGACPYIASRPSAVVNTRVQRPPLRHRLRHLVRALPGGGQRRQP